MQFLSVAKKMHPQILNCMPLTFKHESGEAHFPK